MLFKYVEGNRYTLGDRVRLPDGASIDPTRGCGIPLRPKGTDGYFPQLALPGLRQPGQQLHHEPIIISHVDCRNLERVARNEFPTKWTDQGYDPKDLLLVPGKDGKIVLQKKISERIEIDFEESVISFGPAWECRATKVAGFRTTTMHEESRALLVHRSGCTDVTASVTITESSIRWQKTEYYALQELFQGLISSSTVMGYYRDMPRMLIEYRMRLLARRIEEEFSTLRAEYLDDDNTEYQILEAIQKFEYKEDTSTSQLVALCM